MKKLYTLILFAITTNAYSQIVIDTTKSVYDFNSLSVGNLDGQDNWNTNKFNTNFDIRVIDSLMYDTTKGIYFDKVGSGVGVSANRPFDSIFPAMSINDYTSTYVFAFDIKRSYWGSTFGIAYDANGDGSVSKNDASEIAFKLSSGSVGGDVFTSTSGTVSNFAQLTNAWSRVEIILFNLNQSQPKFKIRSKVLGTSNWTDWTAGLNFNIDTNANSKMNPSKWDNVMLHIEGATGTFDNFEVTRLTPFNTSGIIEAHENQISIYPNPASDHITVELINADSKKLLEIFDVNGKVVIHQRIDDKNKIINISSLAKGVYGYRIISNEKILQQGKLVKM